ENLLDDAKRAQERIEQAATRLQSVTDTTALVTKQLSQLRTKCDNASALKTDFKSMRLVVVDMVLDYLNSESNLLLSQFGMGGTKIIFASEEVSKSGTSKPSLSVTVERNGVKLPFVAYSPGERQRLRIISAFGVADVIQGLSGVKYDF